MVFCFGILMQSYKRNGALRAVSGGNLMDFNLIWLLKFKFARKPNMIPPSASAKLQTKQRRISMNNKEIRRWLIRFMKMLFYDCLCYLGTTFLWPIRI